MKTETISIESLTLDPANARRHGKRNLEAIKGSLLRFGQQRPVVVDQNGVVVAGNGTVEAARALGWTELKAVRTALVGAERTAFAIADNRTAELAAWDDDALARALEALRCDDAIDELATGFTEEEIERIVRDLGGTGDIEEDEVPAPPKEPVARPGDLWILGDHRLLCGDSTKPADVERLMGRERAILFATDPPYLVDYDGKNHPQCWRDRPSKNKDWSESYHEWDSSAGDGRQFYLDFTRTAVEAAIAPNAAWYCWHASRRQALLESVWEELGAFVHQQIIWSKTRPVLTRSVYMWRHEPCFFGWLKGKKPSVYSSEMERTTVWDIANREVETDEHPTSKPVRIFAVPLQFHTKEGEIAYEPFSGSGSQIIAAERLGRRCFALELEPRYVDVAVARWEALTGKTAERQSAPP